MVSAKQGGNGYHFYSLWVDLAHCLQPSYKIKLANGSLSGLFLHLTFYTSRKTRQSQRAGPTFSF